MFKNKRRKGIFS